MKRHLILCILFLPIKLLSQIPIDSASHQFVYEGVIRIDSMSTDSIFNNAREWIVRHLKSSDNNINLTDNESKSLTSTGNIHLDNRTGLCSYKDINLNFKFSVFIKQGRYKYILENFFCSYVRACGQYGTTPESSAFENIDFGSSNKRKIYEDANIKILNLIKDLEVFIKSSNTIKKNDW